MVTCLVSPAGLEDSVVICSGACVRLPSPGTAISHAASRRAASCRAHEACQACLRRADWLSLLAAVVRRSRRPQTGRVRKLTSSMRMMQMGQMRPRHLQVRSLA